MKTPEEMAEEYCNTKKLSYVEKLVITKGFIDGYKAAKAIVEEELPSSASTESGISRVRSCTVCAKERIGKDGASMKTPEEMVEKLRTCPWCGGQASLDWYAMPNHPTCKAKVEICCPSLQCAVAPITVRYIDNYRSKKRIQQELIRSWNTRKAESVLNRNKKI